MKKILFLLGLLFLLTDTLKGQTTFELPNMPLPNVQQFPALCVPTAAIAHLATWRRAQQENWIFAEHDSLENLSRVFNPMFNYNLWHIPGNPAGSAPPAMLKHLADQGGIDMVSLPYTYDTSRAPFNLRYLALENRGGEIQGSDAVSVAKSWLLSGLPVIGLFRPGTGPNSHCVFIYGFDDNFNFGNGYTGGWKFQDSNGPNWLKGTPYIGPNRMWYFYTISTETKTLPEYTIWLKSNLLYSPATYQIPDSVFKIKFSFVKNSDTLKTEEFTSWPVADDYLFPIDLLEGGALADELVITATYTVWLYNQSVQPLEMAIDSLAHISSTGFKNNLSFTSQRVDAVLDSVVLNPTLIKRLFYSRLTTKARIFPVGLEEKRLAAEKLLVYPNPVPRGSTIKLVLSDLEIGALNKAMTLEIIATNGQTIQTLSVLNLKSGQIELGVSDNLPAGIYLLRLQNVDPKNGFKITKKIVVY